MPPERFPEPNNDENQESYELPETKENYESQVEELSQALDNLADFFGLIEEFESRNETESEKFEYYLLGTTEREFLFECFRKTSEYIHQEKIADILFLDRSSRGAYAGIKECYRQLYPNDPQPQVYFVNPRGFNLENFSETPMSLKMPLFAGDKEKERRIDNRFAQTFTQLILDKDKPILVFDTCIHRGKAIEPILESLRRQNFVDVRVGVFGDSGDRTATIEPDFVMIDNPRQATCYPFGKDDLVKPNMDIVSEKLEKDEMYSNRTFDRASQLRHEFVQLVRDGVEGMKRYEE